MLQSGPTCCEAEFMPELNIVRLDQERLAEAYPLIRAASGATLRQWQAFATALLASGGGVLAAVPAEGCLIGLATFRPVPSLAHVRSLAVDIFLTFEIGGRGAARKRLHRGLRGVARDLGCSAIEVRVRAGGSRRSSDRQQAALELLGLSVEALQLSEQLG